MNRYEVQTFTVCDGWLNVWHDDDEPATFPTRAAAQAELDDFFDSLPDAMRDDYTRDDYRIEEVTL